MLPEGWARDDQTLASLPVAKIGDRTREGAAQGIEKGEPKPSFFLVLVMKLMLVQGGEKSAFNIEHILLEPPTNHQPQ
jgi:hypothetical protein